MFSRVQKTGFISVTAVFVLLIVTLAGRNTVFAADNKDFDSRSNPCLVQSRDKTTVAENIAGYIVSLITPKDACAAAVILTCKDYCSSWIIDEDGVPCCESWVDGTPPKCTVAWKCVPIESAE